MKHPFITVPLLLLCTSLAQAVTIDTRQVEPQQGSTSVFVDTKESPRKTTVGRHHNIKFDSSWDDGSMVRVKVNGEVLTNTTSAAAGQLLWSPTATGSYDFEHFDGGTTLSASFIVGEGVGIENITARQRYPWNGLVDLTFTVTGDASETYDVSFIAKDVVGGTNLTIETLLDTKGAKMSATSHVQPGSYHWIWNADADLPDGFQCSRVVIEANASEIKSDGLYMIVDLSGGPTATKYPVSYLDAVPTGGWTDEHKTTKLVLRKIAPGTCVVTVDKPYFIGVFELTQKQYALVTGTEVSYAAGPSGPATPIEHVSYASMRAVDGGEVTSDCMVGRLRKRTSLTFDLPTETQWEYACRAGTTTTFFYGDSASSSYMWYDGTQSAIDVGLLKPNNFGLYDVHGNVAEWCLEMYDSDSHVVRGGHRESKDYNCTATVRKGSSHWNMGLNHDGFRLVVNLE